jgi:hypothetical protein
MFRLLAGIVMMGATPWELEDNFRHLVGGSSPPNEF